MTAGTCAADPSGSRGWTGSTLAGNAVQNWDNQGPTTATVPTGYNTFYQTLTQVSGGAVLQFDFAWDNAQKVNPAPNGSQPSDGSQARLVVGYGTGLSTTVPAANQYVEIFTAPFQNVTANNNQPGPFAATGPIAGSAATRADGLDALNNAVLLSSTSAATGGATMYTASNGSQMPRPINLSNIGSNNWATVRVRLPDNIPATGTLIFGVQRTENQPVNTNLGANEGDYGTDDFYVRNVTVNDRTLCIVKTTPSGNGGTFNFTSGNLTTAGATNTANPSFSLTTTGGSAAYDSDSGTAGTQPALVNANTVTVGEATSAAYALGNVVCTDSNGATVAATFSGGNATIGVAGTAGQPDPSGAITAGLMTTCTLTNAPTTHISITKTDLSAVYSPGGNATYTITLTNNGGPASPIVLTDTLPLGITVNSMSCAASTGSSCGTAAQTTPLSSSTGTTAIALYNNAGFADGRTTAQTVTITLNVTFAASPSAY